jgi:hypothetical protein
VQSQPTDERQTDQSILLDGKIDDDDVGASASVSAESVNQVGCERNICDARVFEHAATTLQNDRMIIDNENFGHGDA